MRFVRVHDIRENRRAIQMMEAIQGKQIRERMYDKITIKKSGNICQSWSLSGRKCAGTEIRGVGGALHGYPGSREKR